MGLTHIWWCVGKIITNLIKMTREKPSLEHARQFYKSLWTTFEIAFLEMLENLTKTNKQQYIKAYNC